MRLCFALLLILYTMAEAQVPHATATEGKLIALENAWNQAQIHHDARVLESLVGDHFIYTDTDGSVMNKAQFLADAQDMDYKANSATDDEWKIDVYDNTAVVSGRYHTKGTYKKKAFDHYGRFTDTWVYLNGQWQCVASHTTLVQPK
ncbi:MAG: nuclear transport factor 2 family protein [Terriglobales bacterium]